MPTSPDSDVVPLRKSTKRKLAEVKGQNSYDDLLTALLEAVPPKRLAAIVEQKRKDDARAWAVRKQAEERARRGLERSPEKQVLIANLARQRWAQWARNGRVEALGPRLVVWKPRPKSTQERVKIDLPRRRGFPPEEGP